ncbi:MAG TPA: ATP-binding protein [Candidatus Limnocylindria bacterium]|nr:ATP-binding protein [Candidatus Limnocylindria bacterium]
MRLAQRLLLGSLLVVGVILVLVIALSERGLRGGMLRAMGDRMEADARLLGELWRPGVDTDSLADATAALLGFRVTLIDTAGTVVGDSQFDVPALGRLENHASRPEIVAAREAQQGEDLRVSESVGDEELYVAVRARLGFARVAVSTVEVDRTIARAGQSVLIAGMIGGLVAVALALLFARAVSRPVEELSEVAREIASGDLSKRPSLAAPGEVGDLADALQRMTEQLSSRLVALEEEDVLLGALIESLNEAVVAVNARRQVVRINEAARRLLSIRAATPFSADLLPRERELRDALGAAMTGRTVDAVEFSLGERTLALTSRPLARGGAVLAAFDLTEVRRLETIRRDFVANVSHELKTPLTVIGGFAETLADPGVPASERDRFAAMIVANVKRMQRIVDDLLDLSRIESGGWVPQPTNIDVAVAAAEAILPCREPAREKGVTLEIDVPANAASATADPTAVRQIIANLVENSLRYTPTEGRITVFAERERTGVWIGVRDTGIGIPLEHLPRIFERFYRVDPARSREAGGTGLGLSIVRHLAEAHGGRVRADSTLGRGTAVAAFFPDARG